MSQPIRAAIASIADMRFHFDLKGDGFSLTIIGGDNEGNDVEVTFTGEMAVGVADGINIAMEQNAERRAAIAAGVKSADQPEIRMIPEIRTAH